MQLYFSNLLGSWFVCRLPLKIEFRSCARGRQWCGTFITIDKQLRKQQLLLVPPCLPHEDFLNNDSQYKAASYYISRNANEV